MSSAEFELDRKAISRLGLEGIYAQMFWRPNEPNTVWIYPYGPGWKEQDPFETATKVLSHGELHPILSREGGQFASQGVDKMQWYIDGLQISQSAGFALGLPLEVVEK